MSVAIKHIPVENRPRERLHAAGPAALSDAELVALVFGGDLPAAEAVVTQLGGPQALLRSTQAMLCEVPGVGPARAAQLLAALELGRRAAALPIDRSQPLSTAERVARACADLTHLEVEELHVLALDLRHRLVARFTSARGEANLVHVSPRDIFRRALREGAAQVVIVHNHPSGNPIPSPEDVALTERLLTAGTVVGVPVCDHVIVAAEGWFSFAERTLLWSEPRG